MSKYYGGKTSFSSKSKLSICQRFTICNAVCAFRSRILLKPWFFFFRKDLITAKFVSQSKCLEERMKLRYTLEMEKLVLHSSMQTRYTFPEVMFALDLEWRWDRKQLINQSLVTTMSTYALSRYTHTRLRTNLLRCCAIFPLFHSWKLGTS